MDASSEAATTYGFSPPRHSLSSSASDLSSPTQSAQNSWNFSSPSPSSSSRLSGSTSSSKRGRPKSENLKSLIVEGQVSPSTIKCKYCGRVFPRDKSLNAHERIHTGLRPYSCDFPGCTRAFTQSGQLKTHQRLHTGEKPFKCSVSECKMAFTHANRHCPNHPYSTLIRCGEETNLELLYSTEQNGEVLKWLERYRASKDDKTPKRRKLDHHNDENFSQPVVVPTFAGPKSRKGLMCELDMNAGLGSSPTSSKSHVAKAIKWSQQETTDDEDTTTSSPINPKKKWLRDAWQDDLAKPLADVVAQSPPPPPKFGVLEANQNRPTVLMIATKDMQTAPINLSLE